MEQHFDLLRSTWEAKEFCVAIDSVVSPPYLTAGMIIFKGIFRSQILELSDRKSRFNIILPDDLVPLNQYFSLVRLNTKFELVI